MFTTFKIFSSSFDYFELNGFDIGDYSGVLFSIQGMLAMIIWSEGVQDPMWL